MLYKQFKDLSLSRLGFGTMRLPTLADGKSIDVEKTNKMVRYAMEHGVNYFDTAYPYMGGKSEIVIGQALKQFPRDQYYLATKYPGHQISDSYVPSEIFEEQLKKCDVEYFDFYLLHNVCESSIGVYCDPQWGIIDFFLEQKRQGRIRHLGFSSHGRVENLREFLDRWGEHMEFCQIQLNYLDWSLQDAKTKYEMLTQRGIPVWVMEPVHGGRLAKLSDQDEVLLQERRPEESIPAWCFRWLQGLPNVTMVLSGMSNMAQMEDNVKTFSAENPLTEEETTLLYQIADRLKNALPCTGCRYCCDGCPMGLDIPMLIQSLNDIRFEASAMVGLRIETLPPEKQPSACLGCGACEQICPQQIPIRQALKDLVDIMPTVPSWIAMCKQRAEEARRNREAK